MRSEIGKGRGRREVTATCSLLLLVVALVLTGCSNEEPGPADASPAPPPFVVHVSDEAQRAAEAVGVDLERLVSESATTVMARLPHLNQIDIAVEVNPADSIPEVGVGGYTDSHGDVFISIDDTPRIGLRAALDTWIPATLAHELHHSSRTRVGPGYGTTLGDALVSEGLADHFVYELFPETPEQPWDDVLSKQQERVFWERALPILGSNQYGHRRWFFAAGNLPRWTGYTLGFRVVEAYLGTTRTAEAEVGTSSLVILKPYTRLAKAQRGR